MDIRVQGFFTKTKRNGKPVEYVRYFPAHGAASMMNEARVSKLIPPADGFEDGQDKAGTKMFHMKAVWSKIEPHYKAWKEGYEMPETGTPLRAWPGVTDAQIFELNRAGIKSVQQLAETGDGGIDAVKLPNVRALRVQAQEFVKASEVNETADAIAGLEAKNAELAEKLDAAMEMLSEATKKPAARGRPKKEVETA